MDGARAVFEPKCNSYLGVLCNGPNGLVVARAAFERKCNGPL